MEVGAKLIGAAKINTKVFCKETIEKLTNDWSGVSYLVLRSKHMVPGCRSLISIGYKYNERRVISLNVIEN